MEEYIIVAPATFNAGILGLTEEQAAVRRHALKKLADGRYEVASPVQFKAGEKIGYAGEMPKTLGQLLETPDGTPALEAVKKPSARKAKAG